ncbi:MAG TPA: helix-turn-helix transcriptional regulator [Thermoanaerobaculia bacterium]
MSQEKVEVRRLVDVLQTLMRMLAVSNREVERRLDLNHATVNRLLNGQIEAKLELVLGVARAIGLEYEEFWSFAYPDRPSPKPESEAARKIRSMLEDLSPGKRSQPSEKGPGPLDRAELVEDVKAAVREIMAEMGNPEAGGAKGAKAGKG